MDKFCGCDFGHGKFLVVVLVMENFLVVILVMIMGKKKNSAMVVMLIQTMFCRTLRAEAVFRC